MPGDLFSFSQIIPSVAVVYKPKQISSIIRNKFGSADNIATLNELGETQGEEGVIPGGTTTHETGASQSSPKYGSDDNCCSTTLGSAGAPGGPPTSKDPSPDHTQASGFDALLHEIQELWEKQGQLEENIENLKAYYQQKYTVIVEVLQEEQYRCDLLEEQLNDLIELHQNEILNLKEELASMEDKIAYQSYERGKDIHEVLEACHTRISKMELQQQRQQQVLQPDSLENAMMQTVLGKLFNVLLAVMGALLVFVSTVANCVAPLMKTPSRMFSTLLLVVLCSLLWRHWDAVLEYHHLLSCTQHPKKGRSI